LFGNSLYLSLIPVLQILVCLPAAYALSRLKFFGRDVIFMLFMSAQMLPGQLTAIQNYVTMAKAGLVNNLNALILLGIFSPLCLFTMRQFFLGLPKELEEAGKLDGCGVLRNLLYVIVPLCLPVVAVNLILCFNGVWGDFFMPMILLKRPAVMTLPVGLTVLLGALRTQDPTVLMAALTLTCLPVVVIFFAFRRYFLEGIAMSGVKA
jgi:multiple sugar transport system permease protein